MATSVEPTSELFVQRNLSTVLFTLKSKISNKTDQAILGSSEKQNSNNISFGLGGAVIINQQYKNVLQLFCQLYQHLELHGILYRWTEMQLLAHQNRGRPTILHKVNNTDLPHLEE